MRNHLAASTLAILSAVLLSACASADSGDTAADTADTADTASTSQALARRGIDSTPPSGGRVVVDPPPPPPPTPPTPPRFPNLGLVSGADVLAPLCAAPGTARRFDLRRKTRSCEDLPGAYVADNATLIAGAGGHYRVGRLLDGTSAPAVIQAKACIYTWEPDDCAAPDTAKLLLESDEAPTERPAICITNPASCAPIVAPPSPFRTPHVIPNGPGRCEVCGFAADKSLWVVLPDGWRGFQYKLPTETAPHFVYLDAPATPATPATPASTDTTVIEVPLDASVVDQDVALAPAYQ
jgi:hypothetical protein